MPEISEKDLQADIAMMDEFNADTTPEDDVEEELKEEAEGLDYYYNMMLPEIEQASSEDILSFIRKVLGA